MSMEEESMRYNLDVQVMLSHLGHLPKVYLLEPDTVATM